MKKVLFCQGRKFYWSSGDLHTNFGLIKEKDISKKIAKSNKGNNFFILDAKFPDKIDKMSRGPQAMFEKDIGVIIAKTGISKDSIVLEAGSGSGKLLSFLANICKKVYSYEIKEENLKLAKKNLEKLNLRNIELKNKDVYEEIKEKDLDLIILDLPTPWKALKNSYSSLKNGAFLVTYLPNITQVQELSKNLNNKFILVETILINETKWEVRDKIAKPREMLPHSGFISILRKV